MGERMNDIYNNVEYDDNTVLIIRPDVIFVVEHIKYIRANDTLDVIKTISQKMFKEDMMIYKFLFVLCYCRALFELKYEKQYENSMCHDPAYAVRAAIGISPWSYLLTH